MNKIRFLLASVILIMAISLSKGQDTLTFHDTVIVNSLKPETGFDSKSLKRSFVLPGNRSTQTAAAQIFGAAGVAIRFEGISGLATPSLRGTGPIHSPVIWDGFSIQSPMNGTLDLNLIPSWFVDEIKIQYGGDGAFFGTGNIGGAIHLIDQAIDTNTLEVKAGMARASFSNYSIPGSLSISGEKIGFRLKWLSQSGVNDHPYTDPNDLKQKRQFNAEAKLFGLQNDFIIKLTNNTELNIKNWIQKSDRNIPGFFGQTLNARNQIDEFYRNSISLKHTLNNNIKFQFKSALFREFLWYKDSLAGFDEQSQSTAIFNEFDFIFSKSKIELLVRGLYHHNWAFSEGYTGNGAWVQNKIGLMTFIKYKINRSFHATLNLRKELINTINVPVVPSASLLIFINKFLRLNMNFSSVYRYPTFNELYWNPGGNINLLPETGYKGDFDLIFNKIYKRIKIESSFSAYWSRIKNMVQWQPRGLLFVVPVNLLMVQNIGSEFHLNLEYKLNKHNFLISYSNSYTRSTNIKSAFAGDNSVGKQLIYIPFYQNRLGITYMNRAGFISTQIINNSFSYITADNSSFIKGFNVLNFSAGMPISISKSLSTNINFGINNLLNVNYITKANLPMPGRNYRIQLLIEFKNKFKPKK